MKRVGPHRQRGVTAVETALIMPVILIGLMMFFELARIALVVIIGNLALDSALGGLRREKVDLMATEQLQPLITERILLASYGYLKANEIQVDATSYSALQVMGADDASTDEPSTELPDGSQPVIVVKVALQQAYITALPKLLALPDRFTYEYRQVLGNLYNTALIGNEQ
ncbi:hypothetical protein K5D32_03970 [Pseudomonas cichorii]|uniref:TadE/TadG family type IV pilus assembly protein n=1 Tax=Pseudomonas cichorii TaxID=36746 RepID=UPI001C8AFA02|nr:hypothetical protein [Pseudomonas cichorii]MBX8528798.1 hypothetical protein [Pseudomonas cichorii]